eukprot:3605371-Pleurochrysis_carterae.AAC.1
MHEAKDRAEGKQKSAKKATRARKAGVNIFTALEPPFDSNPISFMRQELFGLNELEDRSCARLPLYFC